jgi:hypothetical protein
MSTTTKSPTKAQLFDALATFTRSVRIANGIRVIQHGAGKVRGNKDLVSAYMLACKLTGETPIPAVYESGKLTPAERKAEDAKLDQRTTRLLRKWDALVQQKRARKFSQRSIIGCVIDAENAYQRGLREKRNTRRRLSHLGNRIINEQ